MKNFKSSILLSVLAGPIAYLLRFLQTFLAISFISQTSIWELLLIADYTVAIIVTLNMISLILALSKIYEVHKNEIVEKAENPSE
jgi:uncharacterized membrane protein